MVEATLDQEKAEEMIQKIDTIGDTFYEKLSELVENPEIVAMVAERIKLKAEVEQDPDMTHEDLEQLQNQALQTAMDELDNQ